MGSWFVSDGKCPKYIPPPATPELPKPRKRPFQCSANGNQTSVWAVELAVELVVIAKMTRQNAGRLLAEIPRKGFVMETVALASKKVVLTTTASTDGLVKEKVEQRLLSEERALSTTCSKRNDNTNRHKDIGGLGEE